MWLLRTRCGLVTWTVWERYDRVYGQQVEPDVERLHQEDFCQALGIASERKYQKEGGPSLRQCFELLREVSSAPVVDLTRLLEAVIFNYIIGNNDAHGKNFSLLYHAGIRLAPLYDLVCTAYYPELSRDLAMKLGGEYLSESVTGKHFGLLAEEAGLAKPQVRDRVQQVAERVIAALGRIDTANHHAQNVAALIRKRAELLL